MNEAYANWKLLMLEQTALTRQMVAKAKELGVATAAMAKHRDEATPEVTAEALLLVTDAAQITMELLTILLNPPKD